MNQVLGVLREYIQSLSSNAIVTLLRLHDMVIVYAGATKKGILAASLSLARNDDWD
jgi:hypothetical protein